jgi:hypothetical protein
LHGEVGGGVRVVVEIGEVELVQRADDSFVEAVAFGGEVLFVKDLGFGEGNGVCLQPDECRCDVSIGDGDGLACD